ncbi:MAG: hypothetical protein CME10_06615 [Gemmatimonadetes bacterium]|nr:hypothetical protein [Gemmatimonadota bacterium]
MEMGLLNYAESLGMGVAELDNIDVIGTSIKDASYLFLPHDSTPQQLMWKEQRAEEFALG